jgi:hypothetical protein
MLSLKKYFNLQIKKIIYRNSLQKIGECTGSDKVYGHNFIPIYETYFKSLRKKSLNILEIGVGGYEDPKSGGESLLMWSEYFKNSKIIGADLFIKKLNLPNKVKTLTLDQSKLDQIEELGKTYGKFDIIIDDGSHISSHIVNTFKTLWKYLNEQGIYVVEDTQTSYWSKLGGYDKQDPKRATSYFQKLTDGLNYTEFLEQDYTPNEIEKHLSYIHFYHNIIFIGKSIKEKKSLFVDNGNLSL